MQILKTCWCVVHARETFLLATLSILFNTRNLTVQMCPLLVSRIQFRIIYEQLHVFFLSKWLLVMISELAATVFNILHYICTIVTGLMCQSCPQQFGTPWSLMKHAQSVHALKIYLETGPFLSGITKVNCYSEKQFVSSEKSANNTDSSIEVENNRSSIEVPLETQQQSVGLSREVAFMTDSLSSGVQMFPVCSFAAGTHDQSSNVGLLQSSFCKLSDKFENMPQEEYMRQNTFSNNDNLQNISGNPILQTPCNEPSIENVENVSGHSVVLEKCCSSVLPKKRKRHMEIKHASSRKRLPVASSGPTSIYIDLEPGSESHSFQASVSHSSVQAAVTLPESETAEMLQPGLRRRSVIIQPGMTFSIPVSHASVSLAPSLSGPIVADTVIADGTSSYEQASSVVDSNPTASNTVTVTCQPVQESTGDHSQDGLIGEEQCQGKSLDHKRRRYPTSRPFKCDQCDNAFNQRIHLKKHQSKHTGNNSLSVAEVACCCQESVMG